MPKGYSASVTRGRRQRGYFGGKSGRSVCGAAYPDRNATTGGSAAINTNCTTPGNPETTSGSDCTAVSIASTTPAASDPNDASVTFDSILDISISLSARWATSALHIT